ncbi:MAG TPA: hypothetical protein VJ890_26540, partial [Vineibacter sp.]|nr:hypothetical protein [Vineibacter sp.]
MGGRKGAEGAPGTAPAPTGTLNDRIARRSRPDEAAGEDRGARIARHGAALEGSLQQRIEAERAAGRSPGEIARFAGEALQSHFRAGGIALSVLELRDLVNAALSKTSSV